MAIDTYEEALVFAAKNGNTTSFEELYRLYYKKVYALIRMTVKDPSESEDVLQQTFVNAWKNISKLEDNAAFNTWIQRIAVNQCYSVLRKHKEMLTTDSEEQQNVMETLESDFMLPEVYATQQDLSGRLKKIISELSDVQRQTILLYYYNEMSIDEIAETMGCSPGTVKSRLYLARKAIGTEIEEQERKSGQRFFAVAGIPVTAFRGIFGAQVDMDALPQKSAMQLLDAISRKIGFVSKLSGVQEASQQMNTAQRTLERQGQQASDYEGQHRNAHRTIEQQKAESAQRTADRQTQQASDYRGQRENAQRTFDQKAESAQRTAEHQGHQAADYQGQREAAQRAAEQKNAGPHLTKAAPGSVRQASKLGADMGKTAAKRVSASIGNKLWLKVVSIAVGATVVVGGGTAGGVAIVRNIIRHAQPKDTAPAPDPANSIVEEIDDPDLRPVYEAYLQVLEDEEDNIRAYDWAHNEENEGPWPVAFSDLTGDGIPEMLYIAHENIDYTKLHVVTAKDGYAQELLNQDWDFRVAGGMHFTVFTKDKETGFYTIEESLYEVRILNYVRYSLSKDGTSLEREELCGMHNSPYGLMDGENTYTVGGKEATKNKYEKQVKKIREDAHTVLLQSTKSYAEAIEAVPNSGMTYVEAVNWLRTLLGMAPISDLQEVDPAELAPEATDFLRRFIPWYYDGVSGAEFDSENPGRAILTSVVQNAPCVDLSLYPGEGETDYWDEQDPRGWWTESYASYARFDGQQVDWVLKNIFHVSEDDIDRMCREAEDNRELYRDGAAEGDYDYYTSIGGIGDPFINVHIESVKTDGQKFYVTYSEWFEYDWSGLEPEYIATYYAVIAFEQVDGEYYWTMYKNTSQIPEDEPEEAPELFSEIAGDYTFSSGAGGWGTGLHINSDGTFTCEYGDTDFAMNEEYDVVVYESRCHGKLTNPRKLNEYTYAFDMEELIYEGTPGEESITNESGTMIKRVFTNAYGIAEAETFYVYTQDAPVARLPEEFQSWVQWSIDRNSDTLGFTGLYNVNEMYGFYGE